MTTAGALWGLWPELLAQEGREKPAEVRKLVVLEGAVEKLLTNDRNDVHGLKLATGEEVRFPPHVGKKVAELVKPGDQVTVKGHEARRPGGESVFEAEQIGKGEETIQVERPKPHEGPMPPKGPKAHEKPMNAHGKVKELIRNPKEDVDGLRLEDGTEVKFPPHLGKQLEELVKPGEEVRVEGRRHETPKGDVHLHADRIVAVATDKEVVRDKPHGPPGHGKDGPGPHGPKPGATNDDLLRELKAIRKLLEERNR